jgi:hypothetical protein
MAMARRVFSFAIFETVTSEKADMPNLRNGKIDGLSVLELSAIICCFCEVSEYFL